MLVGGQALNFWLGERIRIFVASARSHWSSLPVRVVVANSKSTAGIPGRPLGDELHREPKVVERSPDFAGRSRCQ